MRNIDRDYNIDREVTFIKQETEIEQIYVKTIVDEEGVKLLLNDVLVFHVRHNLTAFAKVEGWRDISDDNLNAPLLSGTQVLIRGG